MGNTVQKLRNCFGLTSNSKEVRHFVNDTRVTQNVYSWDNKPKLTDEEASLLLFDHLCDQKIHRTLKFSKGEQIRINSCSRSLITVTGFSDSVFIDDCIDCKIILGPVTGSVFLRNCNQCLMVAPCGQFRTRDCDRLTCYLLCASEPSIETTTDLRLNFMSLEYPHFKDHLTIAKLDLKCNMWNAVYDFTPSQIEHQRNWKLLPANDRVEDRLKQDEVLHCFNNTITFPKTIQSTAINSIPDHSDGNKSEVDITDCFIGFD